MPIGLLLAPGRIRVLGVVLYLLTISVFYLAAGLAIAAGLGAVVTGLGPLLESRPFYWGEVVLGVGLFLLSFRFDPKRRAAKGKSPTGDWSLRITKATGSPRTLVTLALTAGVIELATMFPFLGAVTLIGSSGTSWPITVLALAGYCVVMILPALGLLGLRLAISDRITPVLERAGAWFEKHAVGATGWILAIVGFLVARDGFANLALIEGWFGM
ncbi:GAP family protein [Kribbella sp. NPDC023972]|uniref:GAP family protein n=1 Tax=Kribbella sp. NPDC023972 TaxID=3154795 RepID=UPI0033D4E248